MKAHYDRQILALTDVELERFVRRWIDAKKATYHEVTRFSGSGDMGRDVVGFLSKERHLGEWDNYQCKQYGKTLPTEEAFAEIGKVLYYAFKGEFTAPRKFYFVAPRGTNRNIEAYIFKPTEFKIEFLLKWDSYCSESIVEKTKIALTPELKSFIEKYDFANIGRYNVDDLLLDPFIKPVLFEWFGADPGAAPKGVTPDSVHSSELEYVAELVSAYSEACGKSFVSHLEIDSHPDFKKHFHNQRERFYDAEAFKRFYRDNTDIQTLNNFEDDIYHGVVDTAERAYSKTLDRVDAVMAQAAQISAGGPISQYARVPVKQGICHHFVNQKRLTWKK